MFRAAAPRVAARLSFFNRSVSPGPAALLASVAVGSVLLLSGHVGRGIQTTAAPGPLHNERKQRPGGFWTENGVGGTLELRVNRGPTMDRGPLIHPMLSIGLSRPLAASGSGPTNSSAAMLSAMGDTQNQPKTASSPRRGRAHSPTIHPGMSTLRTRKASHAAVQLGCSTSWM